MTSHFNTGGIISTATDLDGLFMPIRNIQPYTNVTLDLTIGLATNFKVGTTDIRFRYEPLGIPSSWNRNGVTITATHTSAGATDYLANGTDVASLFAASASNFVANITITANTANLNLGSLISSKYLNPSFFGSVVVTIASGVTIYSNSSSTPALVSGTLTFPTTLINNGTIVGAAGIGGTGGYQYFAGQDGTSGGDAISLSSNITIDNTYGDIYAGGGGGGGGGPAVCQGVIEGSSFTAYYPGGDAGNGAGWLNTGIIAAGPAKIGSGPMRNCNTNNVTGLHADYGGAGGAYGAAGQDGYGIPGTTTSWKPDGLGASAGRAIVKNSHTCTITGGNNGTQIQGAVV
jgi:hypothetical protein